MYKLDPTEENLYNYKQAQMGYEATKDNGPRNLREEISGFVKAQGGQLAPEEAFEVVGNEGPKMPPSKVHNKYNEPIGPGLTTEEANARVGESMVARVKQQVAREELRSASRGLINKIKKGVSNYGN